MSRVLFEWLHHFKVFRYTETVRGVLFRDTTAKAKNKKKQKKNIHLVYITYVNIIFLAHLNVRPKHWAYGVYSPYVSATEVPPMLKCPDYRIREYWLFVLYPERERWEQNNVLWIQQH